MSEWNWVAFSTPPMDVPLIFMREGYPGFRQVCTFRELIDINIDLLFDDGLLWRHTGISWEE